VWIHFSIQLNERLGNNWSKIFQYSRKIKIIRIYFDRNYSKLNLIRISYPLKTNFTFCKSYVSISRISLKFKFVTYFKFIWIAGGREIRLKKLRNYIGTLSWNVVSKFIFLFSYLYDYYVFLQNIISFVPWIKILHTHTHAKIHKYNPDYCTNHISICI